jgi:hypothetical protein
MTDDLPRLLNADGETQVRYRGKNLYSPMGPATAAVRRVRAVSIRPNTLILVPSPVLCYGIAELIERLPEECHIVCVEADENLMALTLQHATPHLLNHPAVSFVRVDTAEGLSNFLHEQIPLATFRRVVVLPLSGGYSLNSEIYRNLASAVEHDIRIHWQNRLTGTYMGRLWVRNTFRNLPLLSRTHDVSTLHTELPVVVAGAGESLEAALPWIRQFRSGLFLLAADTAASALVQSGINPDFVVTVEAQWANIQDFVGLKRTPIVLAGDLSGHPAPFRLFPSSMHGTFLSEFAPTALIRRLKEANIVRTIVPPLGSVGVVAVHLAQRITSSTILLVGLDFAYRRGKTHARGTPMHTRLLRTGHRLSPNSSYELSISRPSLRLGLPSDGPFVTDPVLYSYAENLKRLIGENRRIHVVGNSGVDIGAPRILTSEEFRNQLEKKSGHAERNDSGKAWESVPAEEDWPGIMDRVRLFLDSELSLVETTAARIISYLNGRHTIPGAWEALVPQLEMVDYIYLDFPDGATGAMKSESFLKRALGSAYGYIRTIRQAREMADGMGNDGSA